MPSLKGFFRSSGDRQKAVSAPPPPPHPVSPVLMDNLVYLHAQFGVSSDLTVREMEAGGCKIAIVTLEGMVDRHTIADAVLLPLSKVPDMDGAEALMSYVRDKVLAMVDLMQVVTMDEVINLISSGFAAVMADGAAYVLLGGFQNFMIRGVGEPSSEMTTRGSREGFTEAIRVNISMIRRRMKTPDLTFEMMSAGKTSNTAVCLCYMRGRVSEQLLNDVRARIQKLPLDVVLESGYIQPFLENRRLSLFSSVGTTERPDTLCGKVAEGRIGVLVDGTPFVLITPTLFVEHFQSMDDYAIHPYYASFLRIIKYVSFFVGMLLPGLYVAVGTFHPEMLPFTLMLSYLKSDLSTPFPLVMEALIIHFLFEIMREAGLRFPKAVGHAVSIVGALVIGESAVRAGLIGAPMVIIVALTAISSFVIPSLYGPVTLLRFGFIILGGTLGIYGIMIGLTLLLCSVCAVHIQSIPFTAPVTPFSLKAMRDVLIRADWRELWKHQFLVQNVVGSHLKENGTEPDTTDPGEE
ncbi:MAG: spore germination protein [Clostridiales bacterium]|jgi:spore germination protein KA|nr:spore germination protein [Clostridiales bacterium]